MYFPRSIMQRSSPLPHSPSLSGLPHNPSKATDLKTQSGLTPRSRHPIGTDACRIIRLHIQHAAPATVFLAVARAQLVAAACAAGHGGRIR